MKGSSFATTSNMGKRTRTRENSIGRCISIRTVVRARTHAPCIRKLPVSSSLVGCELLHACLEKLEISSLFDGLSDVGHQSLVIRDVVDGQ